MCSFLNFIQIRVIGLLLIPLFVCRLNAQTDGDYFGNGNIDGISVSSSSVETANNTLIGDTSYSFDEADAVRFLQQSTLGYDYDDVQNLYNIGIDAWIEDQITMNGIGLSDEYEEGMIAFAASLGVDIVLDLDRYIGFAFYNKVIRDNDQMRLRIAFALSQILVLSYATDVTDRRADTLVNYLDIFYQNAFGNFRDILFEVTMHRGMGSYLSYIGNKKEDPEAGTFPDENFAREIMQLFTIGLYELNNDGTHKLDADGNSIPTYDNEDIVQLAKVFTGLVAGDDKYVMTVNEDDHDVGEKVMIDGSVLPPDQTTLEDVNAALDVLFNHDNIAPFICTHLIKQLVKSNPTTAYVNRVATIFNNNGQGVKGDMEAVIKAILLDTEARDCAWVNHPSSGRLLQPLEKFMFLFKALHLETSTNRIHFLDYLVWDGQGILASPSVFNFFSPYYAEPEIVAPAGLVSPEFEIFNSVGSIQYYNNVRSALKSPDNIRNYTAVGDGVFDGHLGNNTEADPLYFDLSYEENLYETQGVAALVDYYNLLLCRNQLTESMQLIIEDTINQYIEEDNGYSSLDAVTDVVLFVMTSPVFNVLN